MNQPFKPNRQGITLLFVISMIVLFLLLGTAFVVVANNFNRESGQRIRSNLDEGKGELQGNQLIEEVMYQLIRGTNLRDIDSPLRANDYLADQYGYGVRSFVSAPGFVDGKPESGFLQFVLTTDSSAVNNSGFDLLTLDPVAKPLSPRNLSGTFAGRVLSFISGPAQGFSVRIAVDAFNSNGNLAFRIPTSSISGDTITSLAGLAGSEVIINGRDFSGSGAAAIFDNNETPTSLGDEAQFPNRIGESHANLITTYLNSSNSVNEPWDAADIATPFLSGFDRNGEFLPSFYSQLSFRAFDEGDADLPDVDTDGDGTPDAYWMDLGMAIVTNAQGQRFRPLVAIQVKDLNGLLNVNAHSNLTHLQNGTNVDPLQLWAGGVAPQIPRGMGLGVPEINLAPALNNDLGILERILNERYGNDNLPGNDSINSPLSRAKLFGHPLTGTVDRLYGTAMDLNGRFLVGTPMTTPEFPDPNNPNFINSLPQIDTPLNPNADEFFGNPYEMSLSGEASGDNPFTVADLERLLRPNDIDSVVLSDRLSSILASDPAIDPAFFTTDSFDVPTLLSSFPEEVERRLLVRMDQIRGFSLTDDQRMNLTNLLNGQLAFAPELFAGLKMDINRPFGDGVDNNGNGVVDEPVETVANNIDAADVFGTDSPELQMDLSYSGIRDSNAAALDNDPRQIYARNLYMLAMVVLDPVPVDGGSNFSPTAFGTAIAQWVVNVVDFRDPDSIHTRFVFDPDPFDDQGWNPTTDENGDQLTESQILSRTVWGLERPELLITETLAGHDRRTEDLDAGGGKVADPLNPPDPDDPNSEPTDTNGDFDQRLRPEAFAFFELYNPWVQARVNQTFPSELYNADGVEITRVNGFGAPVWRFEVERVLSEFRGPKPLRYVYMTDPTGASITYNSDVPGTNQNQNQNQDPEDIEVYYPSTPINVSVSPGAHAVVGTRGHENENEFRTFLGRRKNVVDTGDAANLQLDTTTHLSLNPTAGTVTRYNAVTDSSETREAGIVLVDQAAQIDTTGTAMVDVGTVSERQFSLSDPYRGYPVVDGTEIDDGFIFTSIQDQPLDRPEVQDSNRTAAELNTIDKNNGVIRDFRTIRLQRLANPLIAWDAITNPYLTIDSLEADLISYNGVNDLSVVPEPGSTSPPPIGPTRPDPSLSQERAASPSSRDGQLWPARRTGSTILGAVFSDGNHNFDADLVESIGRTNDNYLDNTEPFPLLTWNNRPFVSGMEIMNVPYLATDTLTYAEEGGDDTFSVDLGTNPYSPARGELSDRYQHLLNFFGGDGEAGRGGIFLDAYKLFDYIEVPSRFVGNESWYLANGVDGVSRHPFNTISHYRVPGKININTIPPTTTGANTSLVWDTLVAEYVSSLSWSELMTSLHGPITGPNTGVTNFRNPFRPSVVANLVPGVIDPDPNADPILGSECTLLRPDASGRDSLFDFESTNVSYNPDRNAAFRNGFRTRMGNMLTTKSSVFAGWVTVGFFEVNQNDELVNTSGASIEASPPMNIPAGTAAEIGADAGEQVRHRGFFIFDRSIPVAYEPGKNHNVDKAILLKTIIE